MSLLIRLVFGTLRCIAMSRSSLALENLLDENYRVHGSGQNEPGRNFILSLDYRF